jgi:hypothetical protein
MPRADFGHNEQIPTHPNAGDMFLRTDVIPNVLFKWNGLKWIEIPKYTTDNYIYNPEFIQDLINRIENGKYSVDFLTDIEQEQIQRYLNDQPIN